MSITNVIQIIVGLIILVGYFRWQQSKKQRSSHVSEMIKAGATVIDVRIPSEFSSGHFKGAINIPLNSLNSKTNKVGKKTDNIIVYCASGSRSSAAVIILRKYGFLNVVNAGGGLSSMPKA